MENQNVYFPSLGTVIIETANEKYDIAMQVINEDLPYIYFYHDYNVFGLSKKLDGFEQVPDVIRTFTLPKK
ncbi:hypothetical protein ABE354_25495 [Brevibacillus laterosporus]|uniref:hypothetical protein n=1 Tax=Brevibacillus laterosporus TaxID=1465 RepID=UPI003D1E4B64